MSRSSEGPESAAPFHPAGAPDPWYGLPEFGLRIAFGPTDFTQVNHAVNRALVSRAVRLLDPRPGERIGDLFCGLGNITLPIASRGARVIGLEGSKHLVEPVHNTHKQDGSELVAAVVLVVLSAGAAYALQL